MAARIKKGDTVQVISGKEKGKSGKVIRIAEERVVIEGLNMVTKHVKPNQRFQQGAKIQKEAGIHISNVMPVDPESGKPTRVKFEMRDGVKHRVAVKSGSSLGVAGKKKAE